MYQYYVERNYTRAPEYRFGIPQQFGIFYAMGEFNLRSKNLGNNVLII